MLFLSLYTPAVPSSGPPSAAHMTAMGKMMEEMTKAGVLVTTGGILSRQTGMKIALKSGKLKVEDGPVAASSLMPASGFALLRAGSRDELAKHIHSFLQIAGDGTCEIIQVMDGPPPKA